MNKEFSRRFFIGSCLAAGAAAGCSSFGDDRRGRAWGGCDGRGKGPAATADASWMKGSIGISSHWTSHTTALDGSRPTYAEAVAGFDVEAYASALEYAGATHCIFTLAHAEQYLPVPLAELDRILPGRTAKRDLVADLTKALAARGIRFIAYYNHSCNGQDDPPWMEACGYSKAGAADMSRFAENIISIVAAIARRYGKAIDGWWFDSAPSVDPRGSEKSCIPFDVGDWHFPWDEFTAAARSGNPGAVIATNAGIYKNFTYTDKADYQAGEATSLEDRFQPPADGIQRHHWAILDDDSWILGSFPWGAGKFAPTRFSDANVISFLDRQISQGQMTTFNLTTDITGKVNPWGVEQLHRCIGWFRRKIG